MMDNKLRIGIMQYVRSSSILLQILPVSLASSREKEASGTLTVVLLVILLIVLCVALILAWKRLIRIEGGESYHPQELWGRAQDMVQHVKSQWNHEGEEGSVSEDNNDEEDELEKKEEEPHITAL